MNTEIADTTVNQTPNFFKLNQRQLNNFWSKVDKTLRLHARVRKRLAHRARVCAGNFVVAGKEQPNARA
jgi:hypothetical protein